MSLFLADYPPSLGSAAAAGEHYMIIDSFESSNAVTSGDKKLSSIGLYIPAGSLKTGFKGNYNAKGGAETVAKMGQGLGMSGGPPNQSKFDVGTLAAALKQKGLSAAAKFGDTIIILQWYLEAQPNLEHMLLNLSFFRKIKMKVIR